jgi:Mg2+ and Co2+ transporter CorA
MKTLAYVTMIFLPGTFVASFFAMPLLNWDAERAGEVPNPRFWIYWVVTVPLTLVVYIASLLWSRKDQLLRRKEDREAREQVGFNQAGK